jgi:putative ABC transport system substrate-binding protein
LKRRRFIAGLAAAAAWPLAGRAQQPEGLRRVGVLTAFARTDPETQAEVTAFAQALRRFGWVEGENIRIDWRFAAGDPTFVKTYATELVELSPDAILASASPAVAALRQQTRTIPIVFAFVSDPVGQGFVQSLARPGGNITGFSAYDAPLMAKWLQLLKEVAPGVTRVAVIFNPDTAPYAPFLNSAIKDAAPSLGIAATLAPVHDGAGIEEAIGVLAGEPGGGLIILPDSFTRTHLDGIIAAGARRDLPLIGAPPRFPGLGGSSPTLSISSNCTHRRLPTSTVSSGEPVRPTSRFSSRPNIR